MERKPQRQQRQEPREQQEQRIIQIPVGSNQWVALQLPVPMPERAWNQMVAVLTAMKPGLIERDQPRPVEHAPPHDGVAEHASKLTKDAQDILDKVDEGGIPLYMTENLKRIAEENGLTVTPENTPNDIIAALKVLDE